MGSYLLQVLGRKGGLGVFSLVIVSCFFMGQGCMVASSRVIYAYSRDGALPGSRVWAKVHPWTRTPVYAGSFLYSYFTHGQFGLIHLLASSSISLFLVVLSLLAQSSQLAPLPNTSHSSYQLQFASFLYVIISAPDLGTLESCLVLVDLSPLHGFF